MTTSADPSRHTNRLIHETSPYLLQHAHNPVDWYPWGAEALARARAENRPILLSIGYSACHWCHVMERESFEDEAIAALMNRHFVNIKVDREERPDLDDIYMAATLALNRGQGGWPMTVFLTPDQRPFFAGTYFPPAGPLRAARLLAPSSTQIADLWERRRPDLVAAGRDAHRAPPRAGRSPSRAGTSARRRSAPPCGELADGFDSTYGGFGPAPKFPPAAQISLLLRHHRRTGDAAALAMATKTLDGMAQGGMYDQIGGGFARYSTDERWLVPHFEKMLYDNALLAKTYLEGYQVTGDAFYARIAREILEYILREMVGPRGRVLFGNRRRLGGRGGQVLRLDAGRGGGGPGPRRGRPALRLFRHHRRRQLGGQEHSAYAALAWSGSPRVWGSPSEAFRQSLEDGRARLYEARRQRVPPGLDDKVLTAWNGMMLGAMAEGARVLGDSALSGGGRAGGATFCWPRCGGPTAGCSGPIAPGRPTWTAYLEDYAFLAEGLLDLYEAGGDIRYLRDATGLAERILADFGDRGGRFLRHGAGPRGAHRPAQGRRRRRHPQRQRRGRLGARPAVLPPGPGRLPRGRRRAPSRPTAGPSASTRGPSAGVSRSWTSSWRVRSRWPSSGRRARRDSRRSAAPSPDGFFPTGSSRTTTLPARRRPTCRCFAGRASSMGRRRSTSAGTSPARRR